MPRPQNTGVAQPESWFVDWIRGGASDSGVTVTADSSLTYSTIWQAVNVLAGDVGQLPLDRYKRTGDDGQDREVDRAHVTQNLVRWRANEFASAQDFWETLMVYALLWGNGMAEIERDERGRAVSFTPLLPDRTHMEILTNGRPLVVTRQGDDYDDLGSYRAIRYSNVFHLKGISWNGLWGVSVIEKARNSWGLGLSQEKYANKYFANDARPSGTLETPEVLDDKAYARLRADWKRIHEGLDNVGRIAILEQGSKFNPMSFTNRDSQWLESRQFQRGEIASWFNLPPHKVGDMKDATFSNIEEQNRNYLNTSLMRWLVKIAAECREKLLTDGEKAKDSRFFEHNTAALLRGDLETRMNAYAVAINNRVMCPNEARRRENLPAFDGGDEFLVPLNIGQGGGDNAPNDPDPTPDANTGGQAQDANKEAFRAQLNYIADVEAKRIRQEARKPDRFIAFMERFYSVQWPRQVRDLLTPWGQAERAEAWCARSLEILDQVVGTASAPRFADAIEDVLKEWPGRVEAMVKDIFPKGNAA